MRIRVNGSSANEESLSSSTNTEISAVSLYIIYIFPHTLTMDEILQVVEKKCHEYSKLSCKLSSLVRDKSEKIILGNEAPLGLFPHMAYMQLYSDDNHSESKTCGGALISERWILSAAHCASKLSNVKGWVKLGSTSREIDDTGQLFLVDKVLIHPKYNEEEYLNDMLLVRLNRWAKFNAHVRPICLNAKLLSKYEHIYVAGWGRTENQTLQNPPKKLRYTRLYIDEKITHYCKAEWRSGDDCLICTGHPNSSANVYVGDSGGPLMVPYNSGCAKTYEAIGVTHGIQNRSEIQLTSTLLSWHFKVELYIPWIVNNVWPYGLKG